MLNSSGKGALLLLFLSWAAHPTTAQSPAEPFTAVQHEQLTQTNAMQSLRLKEMRDLPTTQSVHLLRMNQSVPIGEKLKITIPDDKTLIIAKTGGESHDSRDFTWFGVVQGQSKGSATLASRNGEISGSINTTSGVYRLTSLGGGLYAIVKVNPKNLPLDEPPAKDRKKP